MTVLALSSSFSFLLFQTANEKFVREKQSGQAASEREAMLKDLATAYDIYMELIGNLQEGTKVHRDWDLLIYSC